MRCREAERAPGSLPGRAVRGGDIKLSFLTTIHRAPSVAPGAPLVVGPADDLLAATSGVRGTEARSRDQPSLAQAPHHVGALDHLAAVGDDHRGQPPATVIQDPVD